MEEKKMEIIDDKEVMLAAVKETGTALRYASARLQDNEEVVLAAVNQNGTALTYASARLKDDEAIVLAAVEQDSYALIYASARLRSDVNFCIECAKKNPEAQSWFKGEARKLFEKYQNVAEVEKVYTKQQAEKKQQQDNEALLSKIKKNHTQPNFKMNILELNS
jgi:hypothetical protein